MRRTNLAFGLPAGSIRGLLAVIVFFGIWVWLGEKPHEKVPYYMQNLMFIIMGHYFSRTANPADEPPLFLPWGTIRFILVSGFVFVFFFLLYKGDLIQFHQHSFSNSGVSLLLVTGFMIGVLKSYVFKTTPSRMVEDIRAVVALIAAILMVGLVLEWIPWPHASVFAKFKHEELLAAIVGFYFGARSHE